MYTQDIVIASCGNDVTSPCMSGDGALFIALENAGNVMRVRDDKLFRSYTTTGQISAASFDFKQQYLYVADMSQGAILRLSQREQGAHTVVNDYEDKPFLGPHSVKCARWCI